jgi:hypothetical protein
MDAEFSYSFGTLCVLFVNIDQQCPAQSVRSSWFTSTPNVGKLMISVELIFLTDCADMCTTATATEVSDR